MYQENNKLTFIMQKVMHQNQDRTDDVTMPGRKLMIFQVVAAAQFCGVIF